MRIAGFLLLLSGWFLVLSALVLLRAAWPQAVFILASVAVEVLGLAIIFRSYVLSRGKDRG